MSISAGDELQNISALPGKIFILHKNNVCILLSKKKLTNLWSQGKIGEFFQTEDQKSQPKISSKNPKIARKEHKKKQGKKANFVKIEKCKKSRVCVPPPRLTTCAAACGRRAWGLGGGGFGGPRLAGGGEQGGHI